MLLYRESQHYTKFIDLFTISLKNKGSTLYLAMILIMNNRKMNLYNRLEYKEVI
jgi:hypothetical protein